MTNMSLYDNDSIPWKEGCWRMGEIRGIVLETSGKKQLKWKNLVLECQYGKFGRASKEITVATGSEEYNLQVKSPLMNNRGVLNDTGTKITIYGVLNKLEEWVWMNEETMKKFGEDNIIPYGVPSSHTDFHPEMQGRIVWVSGPPGSGKSATCQLMARENNYIYYEADCCADVLLHAMSFQTVSSNGYITAGYSDQDNSGNIAESIVSSKFFGTKASSFRDADLRMKQNNFFKVMANDLLEHKKSLGGNFAVEFAVADREARDLLRSLLGPDLVFIVLSLSKDCLEDRLRRIYGEKGAKELQNTFSKFRPAENDEEGAYNVIIQADTSRDEILREISKIFKKLN